MMAFLIMALFVVAALLSAALVRAALARPSAHAKSPPPLDAPVDPDGAARRLSALIQKKTVSSREAGGWDEDEFASFRKLLAELYPEAHKILDLEIVAGHSMLFRWKGRKGADPVVLMSHYDVVPANEDGWTHPAFSGAIADGKVWGRGTLDTKGTVVCALEAVEALVRAGFTPETDLYLSFGHNEEIGGDGAPSIVDLLAERGVKPRLVLDEGGGVVSGVFPGVSAPLAMVGVAEKGVADVELSVSSSGGHSSTPPRRGAAWRLARAIIRLEAKPFPGAFPAATKTMFMRIAPYAPFGLRLLLANLWLFEGALVAAFGKLGGELNAMTRTTAVATMLKGSDAANVLPAEAKAVVNCRIAVGSSLEKTMARLAAVIRDPKVTIRVLLPGEPSPVSEISGEAFEALAQTIREVYPGTVVVPYVVMGGTDSRHFARISSRVYRFSPFEFSKADRASMHAVNESIEIRSLSLGVEFYLRLIRAVA